MQLLSRDIPKLVDISCVRTNVTTNEIKLMAEVAQKYGFLCVFAMPSFTPLLRKEIVDSNVMVGGVAGFPSGADTTEIKVITAKQMVAEGCDEIDMVINVGALLSGEENLVYNDIKAVVDAVAPIPVKAILEIAYLSDNEIRKGAELATKAGVAYVKTGTGWGPKPTTVETIKIIKEVVGDRAKIKAAGGVRTLEDLEGMYNAGCERFGISISSALSIIKEAYEREGIPFPE